ncbi:hypothetical protein ILYODFUR_030710 [Ilyodon furcidens]|uniref:Uncharacterized protein n=1 Tax=Ilyodon furcidens TaxID=33524 RepID=A0ABV0TPT5_9TELE
MSLFDQHFVCSPSSIKVVQLQFFLFTQTLTDTVIQAAKKVISQAGGPTARQRSCLMDSSNSAAKIISCPDLQSCRVGARARNTCKQHVCSFHTQAKGSCEY